MQTEIRTNTLPSFEGMVADNQVSDSLAKPASETVEFGRFLVLGETDGKTIRKPMSTKVNLVFSGALGASNSTVVTVNGNATVAEVYATSNTATLTAIAVKVAALTGIASCTVDATNNTLIITANDNTALVVSAVVTGGSAVTAVAQNNIKESIFGVSIHQHKMKHLDGTSNYSIGETVPAGRKIRIWVRCEDAFTVQSSAFIRIVDEAGATQKRGMLKTSAGASYVAIACSKVTFLNSGSAGDLAKVEVTLP